MDYHDAVRRGRETTTRIAGSGLTIYDAVESADQFLERPELQALLNEELAGLNLNLPIRTRSKVVKEVVCDAMGYPRPKSFEKTQPRFPGQDLDVYVQKSNNLQIWNEEIAPARRYAIVRVDEREIATGVRVLTGQELALLDRTGTLTSKFQARRRHGPDVSRLVVKSDTPVFQAALEPRAAPIDLSQQVADDLPKVGEVLDIASLHSLLQQLIGTTLRDPGAVQDRLRGVELQKVVCGVLGIGRYADSGQFPDIMAQAVEVKLQTSPTVDLGLVLPSSNDPAEGLASGLRHADVRYAVIFGQTDADLVTVESVVTTTGEAFFDEFIQFEGKVSNTKLQIPLPKDLFG